jgi:hypothetical protein
MEIHDPLIIETQNQEGEMGLSEEDNNNERFRAKLVDKEDQNKNNRTASSENSLHSWDVIREYSLNPLKCRAEKECSVMNESWFEMLSITRVQQM